jgi:hypothetical protein
VNVDTFIVTPYLIRGRQTPSTQIPAHAWSLVPRELVLKLFVYVCPWQPENLLLAYDPTSAAGKSREQVIKIADFGWAGTSRPPEKRHSLLTQPIPCPGSRPQLLFLTAFSLVLCVQSTRLTPTIAATR